jgi:hypothetical protein
VTAAAAGLAVLVGLGAVTAVQTRARAALAAKNGELTAANNRTLKAYTELAAANARAGQANAELEAAIPTSN